MTAAEHLTCKELVELVTDYLEGTLTHEDRFRFEEHLTTCPPCQAHIDQMVGTIRALGHVPEEAISVETEQSLLEAFRGWKRG